MSYHIPKGSKLAYLTDHPKTKEPLFVLPKDSAFVVKGSKKEGGLLKVTLGGLMMPEKKQEPFEDPARNQTPEERAAHWGVDDEPRFLTKDEAEELLQGRVMPTQRKKPDNAKTVE